ncbi:hypothetical protein YC2023_117806 [Brassica napus]
MDYRCTNLNDGNAYYAVHINVWFHLRGPQKSLSSDNPRKLRLLILGGSTSYRAVPAPPFSTPRREPSVSSPWKQNRRFHLLLKIKVTNVTLETTPETNVTNTIVSSSSQDTIPVHDSVEFASANSENPSHATKAAQHVEAADTHTSLSVIADESSLPSTMGDQTESHSPATIPSCMAPVTTDPFIFGAVTLPPLDDDNHDFSETQEDEDQVSASSQRTLRERPVKQS